MSHYVTVQCQYKDQGALVEALEEIAGKGNVEVHAEPQTLVGYHYRLGEPCHVIVRKRGSQMGGLFADMGWRRNADGTFAQYIDECDASHLRALPQRYAVAVTRRQAKLSGYAVQETTAQDGTVRLTLSKWGG